MRSVSSYVSSIRERAAALLHRADHVDADSAERKRRWNQLIAEHQKPPEPPKDSENNSLAQS